MNTLKNSLLPAGSVRQEAPMFVRRYGLALPMGIIGLMLIFAPVAARAQGPQAAQDDRVTPPPVPVDIQVPAGNEAFLVGHATGTQNYVCLPCDPTAANCPSGVAYTLFTPQATLFDDRGGQLTTHFFSPNPFEGGRIRATWQHSRDTSTVWGRATGSSTDPDFVTPGAIPWLLIQVKDVGAQAGPTGGDKLTRTTFIQRVNTVGGAAPSTGCSAPADIGRQAFVPYTTDYFFYKAARGNSRDVHE